VATSLSHIRTVTLAYEALQIEANFLATDPHLQRPVAEGSLVGDKSLLQIELVGVYGREILLAECSVVLELRENLPMPIRMNIRIELSALDDIVLAELIAYAEKWRIVRFKSLP